jgi:20S proteasome alpha/beta subunit
MTLLAALKGKDGFVLAADSRGTFGDPRGVTAQNDNQQKAHILSPHVAALAAGSGELGSLVIDLVKKKLADNKTDGATGVLETLRETARESYQQWFRSIPPVQPPALVLTGQASARPDLAFIVAGYELDGTPRLFTLISQLDFPPMLHDYGFALLGVAQYALYLLNRLYEPDRTVEELTSLAVYVITETASQDGKVGGPVNVITIVPGPNGCQLMTPTAVQKIQEENQLRAKALRDSFYNRGKDL